MTEIKLKRLFNVKSNRILFCAVDNHTSKGKTDYTVIYQSERKEDVIRFLEEKGINLTEPTKR